MYYHQHHKRGAIIISVLQKRNLTHRNFPRLASGRAGIQAKQASSRGVYLSLHYMKYLKKFMENGNERQIYLGTKIQIHDAHFSGNFKRLFAYMISKSEREGGRHLLP